MREGAEGEGDITETEPPMDANQQCKRITDEHRENTFRDSANVNISEIQPIKPCIND